MLAEDLLRAVTDITFTAIFLVVAGRAIRRRYSSLVDAALFFGAVVLLVATDVIPKALGFPQPLPVTLSVIRGMLALVLPLLLLRLVTDFVDVRQSIRVTSVIGFIACAVSLVVFPPPYAPAHALTIVAYFVVVQGYCTWRFIRAASEHMGAFRARMQAAAVGSGALALILFVAAIPFVLPSAREAATNLVVVGGLLSGLSYFIAFAPPQSMRQYWEAPALRKFLSIMVRLPAQSPIEEIEQIVETATAQALGAPHASMVLWDEERQRLYSPTDDDSQIPVARPETTIPTRAYRERRPIAALDAVRADPLNSESYRLFGASAVLSAPILLAARDRCYGVLSVYADHPSVFADDDLALLALIAEEMGGFLHRRELVMGEAELASREEATRLKDEFLSAAAHDLRTPLTIVLAQSQLLQRHLRTRPDAMAANAEEADRLVHEAQRMWRMTDDVLDASRLDAPGFITERGPNDLAATAREIVANVDSPRHSLRVEGAEAIALVDVDRIRQVFQNLVENAVKFSPDGGEVLIDVRPIGDEVQVCVSDSGIGIPPGELAHVFQRFYRGSEVGKRGFGGMGIGLFLCKRIVEEHEGRIWVESNRGRGSSFFVRLPRMVNEQQLEVVHGAAHPGR